MSTETISLAIEALKLQSSLIDRHLYQGETAEDAEEAQRKAHQAIKELTALQPQPNAISTVARELVEV